MAGQANWAGRAEWAGWAKWVRRAEWARRAEWVRRVKELSRTTRVTAAAVTAGEISVINIDKDLLRFMLHSYFA